MKRKHFKLILSVALALTLGMAQATCNGNQTDKNSNNKNIKEEKQMMTQELNKNEFIQKVHNFEANTQTWKFEGNRPCIVDFYASWCGPCKALSPVLEELAKEYEGRIDIYKVNVDKQSDIAAAFGIRSIPTLLFCPTDGQPGLSQGALPKNELKKIIDNNLLK